MDPEILEIVNGFWAASNFSMVQKQQLGQTLCIDDIWQLLSRDHKLGYLYPVYHFTNHAS